MAKILLIDDDKNVRDSIVAVLLANDFKVEQASSAAEANSLIDAAIEYDLILLDLWLGNESGLAVLSSLKEGANCDLPVIVISGGGAGHSLEQAIALADARGADHVLIKPFRNAELLDAISKLLPTSSNGQRLKT